MFGALAPGNTSATSEVSSSCAREPADRVAPAASRLYDRASLRNDVPAALPLAGLIAGLSLAPILVNPRMAAAGLLLAAVLPIGRTFFVSASLGVLLGLSAQHRVGAERAAFASLDPERFVTITAPLERDWAPRDSSFVLRASRFDVEGMELEAPLSIYARFEPAEIGMEAFIRAEGFLKLNERGVYTLSVKSPSLMSYEERLPWWNPAAWNRALANRLERSADRYPEEVALAQALALGRGERLTDEMRDSFRRGGTYHLLVFSGLQIAFAAGLLAALLRWLHAPRASDWLLLAFACIAPLFIGPTASVSRASAGIALYAVSRLLKRPTAMQNLWCLAAFARLAMAPGDLTDASFHLTYAGAGALLFIGPHLFRRRWMGHAAAAEIAITPLTLFHFHQYTLGGSLVTVAMSPLILAMLVASMVACAFPPALAVVGLLHRLCSTLNSAGMAGVFAAPPAGVLISCGASAMLALAMLRGRRRAVVLAALLLVPSTAAMVRSSARRSVANPRVTFFDVGQGDAIAIRSGAHTMLVDGGPGKIVLPLLADEGIRRIDAIVLTHAHPDHCDALPDVVTQFDVGTVWISPRRFTGGCAARLLTACASSRTPIRFIRDGAAFDVGEFTMVAHVADQTFRRAKENNASVVLRAEAHGRRFLFTGDIEREAELYFADRDLAADVLKVAHHGSRSSTSGPVLDAVEPRIAVISCGRRNLFGHPHPTVLGALRERRITIWRTDIHGQIDVEIRGPVLYVRPGSD